MGDVGTREWLAHAALHATLDLMRDRANEVKRQRFNAAVEQLCPDCEHWIIYCKCFERAEHPHRARAGKAASCRTLAVLVIALSVLSTANGGETLLRRLGLL